MSYKSFLIVWSVWFQFLTALSVNRHYWWTIETQYHTQKLWNMRKIRECEEALDLWQPFSNVIVTWTFVCSASLVLFQMIMTLFFYHLTCGRELPYWHSCLTLSKITSSQEKACTFMSVRRQVVRLDFCHAAWGQTSEVSKAFTRLYDNAFSKHGKNVVL